MAQDQFQDAVSAFDKVKQTVAALKAEHGDVVSKIAAVETHLVELNQAYLPFEDLKKGILDLIGLAGERYSELHIRGAIKSFATGGMVSSFSSESTRDLGKPIRYELLERALQNREPHMGRAQLLTPGGIGFDDQVLYFLFGEFVKDGLRNIMDRMTPDEFGYGMIHPGKIGSPLVERRKSIEAAKSELQALQASKADIEGKLAAIGSPLPPKVKGQP